MQKKMTKETVTLTVLVMNNFERGQSSSPCMLEMELHALSMVSDV